MPMSVLARLRAPGALLVVQLSALLWFAPASGFPLDDAWIHQVVARTYATHGTLGYAVHQHGAAATSYLWALILSTNFMWFHADPVRWTVTINVIMSLVSGQLLFALLGRVRPDDVGEREWLLARFGAVVLAFTSANVLWYAHSGMEACMVVALSLGAISLATSPNLDLRRALGAGLCGALLAWTRPETAPLGLALGAWMFLRKRSKPMIAAAFVPPALALFGYALVNFVNTHHVLPSTLAGRSWLWFEGTSGVSPSEHASIFFEEWGKRLCNYTFDTSTSALAALLGLSTWGAIRWAYERGEKNDGARLFLAWAAAHTAFYVVFLPTPGHGGRYQPFLPIVFVVCLALGAFFVVNDIVRLIARKVPAMPAWLPLLVFAPFLFWSSLAVNELRSANELAVAHIQTTEIGMGKFLDTLPDDGAVASFDIGGIGWASKRPVLDAGGLSDPSVANVLERGRLFEILQRHAIRYVVLPEGYERSLPVIDDFSSRLHLKDNPALTLEPIHEIETPLERWAPGIKATWNAAPRQVLYRITYTNDPGPRDVRPPPASVHRSLTDVRGALKSRDRQIAEHMLATLEAWGVPVDLKVTPGARPMADVSGCEILVGTWGVQVRGCASVGDPSVVGTAVTEDVMRYLDVDDLGGAVKTIPHSLARVKRITDPHFYPSLAPLDPPARLEKHDDVGSLLAFAFGMLAIGVAMRRQLSALLVASMLMLGCEGGFGHVSLTAAASHDDIDELSAQLQSGLGPNVRDAEGKTALQLAAAHGNIASVMMLTQNGAALDMATGARKRTALDEAILNGQIEAASALLKAGSNPNVPDSFGETSLHLLARVDESRALPIANLLLDAGANPSNVDARGFTALHALAAEGDHAWIVRMLAQRFPGLLGAKTPAGETALDVAMRYGRDVSAEMLWEAGSVSSRGAWPPLHAAARVDAQGRAAKLLAAGADPTRVVDGKTALDVAREYHSVRCETLFNSRPARP
jgi:ankyrin repeat protein